MTCTREKGRIFENIYTYFIFFYRNIFDYSNIEI